MFKYSKGKQKQLDRDFMTVTLNILKIIYENIKLNENIFKQLFTN